MLGASVSPSDQGSLVWKESKDDNREREETKTGDNPKEIWKGLEIKSSELSSPGA